MEYGRVLKRAWEITWRHKILWILGFLASLGSGGGGGGGGSSSGYRFDTSDLERWPGWTFDRPFPEIWAAISGLVLGLLCLGLIIVIALWVLSVIARGGLIAGVHQVEDEGSTSFGRAWRVGAKRFWTLFGISVLTAIPMFILIVIGIVVLGAGIAAAVGGFGVDEVLGGLGIASTVLGILSLCCLLVPLALILDQIRTYAERAAVIDGLGWTDAFRRGWQVLKENLGPTIVLWIIFLALGLLFAVVVVGGIVGIVAPLGITFGSSNIEPGPWILAPLCFGGLLGAIVLALINSIVTTFTSASWTLAYREFTGRIAAGPAPEEPEPAPEVEADSEAGSEL